MNSRASTGHRSHRRRRVPIAALVLAGALQAASAEAEGTEWNTAWRGRQLVRVMDRAWSPAWSPDGARVACLTQPDEGKGIRAAVIDLATGAARQSSPLGDTATAGLPDVRDVSHLAWHPDGKALAVAVPGGTFTVDLSRADLPVSRVSTPDPVRPVADMRGAPLAAAFLRVHGGGEGGIDVFDWSGARIRTEPGLRDPVCHPNGQGAYVTDAARSLAWLPASRDAVLECRLTVREYFDATGQTRTSTDDDELGWQLTPLACFADGALLLAVTAWFKQPVKASPPPGELVFWPDPGNKQTLRRIGELDENPVGAWAGYIPLGSSGVLLRLEQGRRAARLESLRTNAIGEQTLPADAGGRRIAYACPPLPRLDSPVAGDTAVLAGTLETALAGGAADPETAIRRAIAAGDDLASLSQSFGGTPVWVTLSATRGVARPIVLSHAAAIPDGAVFDPQGRYLLFTMAWRDSRNLSVWIADPQGEGPPLPEE